MTSAGPLSLKRTLSDILEDQLYNMSNGHTASYGGLACSENSTKSFSAFKKEGSVDSVDKDGHIEEFEYISPRAKDNSVPYMFVHPHELNTTEYEPDSDRLRKPAPTTAIQELDLQQEGIFNRYADPNLTTTSNEHDKGEHTPSDTTNITTTAMKTTSFSNMIPNKTKMTTPVSSFYTLPTSAFSSYDIKVSYNPMADIPDPIPDSRIGNALLPEDDSSLLYFYKEDPKSNWPLQDSNVALNSADARIIFDKEFASDDDDLSDEEEEEEEKDIGNGDAIVDIEKEIKDQERLMFSQPTLHDFVDSTSTKTVPHDLQNDNDHLIDTYHHSSDQCHGVGTPNDELAIESDAENDEIYEYNSFNKKSRAQSVVFTDTKHTNKPDGTTPSTINNKPQYKTRKHQNDEIVALVTSPVFESTKTITDHNRLPSSSSVKKTSNGMEVFKCEIINTITKKPCCAEFSRSYDLTRHQNTIHAKKKMLFRCAECIKLLGDEGFQKTFSRLDALSRHIKSKHEELPLEKRQVVINYAKQNIGYAA